MAINNMPAAFQDAFQQNMLQQAFQSQLGNKTVLRTAAQKTPVPTRSGEQVIYSRAGRLIPVVQPSNAANNTLSYDLGNNGQGVGSSNNSYPVEQFSIGIFDRDQDLDINIVQDRQTLSSIYMQNWVNIAEQAGSSMDMMCMQRLATAYESGSSYVATGTYSSNTAQTLHLDNINGLSTVFATVPVLNPNTGSNVNVAYGQPIPVSNVNPLAALYYPAAGGSPVTCSITLANPDATNVSTMVSSGMINGVSGTVNVTFGSAITPAIGDVIVAADAPQIFRPRARSRYAMTASSTANMQMFLNQKALLGRNGVKPFSDGTYLCVLDDTVEAQLFTDPQFQVASQGAIDSEIFVNGTVVKRFGLTFVKSTTLPVYPFTNVDGQALVSHRAFVLGQGAIQEGTFTGMAEAYRAMADQALSHVEIVDDYALITRPALDRKAQIWSQTWTWIGGHTCGTDATITSIVVPTATASRYKRAGCIEVVDVF